MGGVNLYQYAPNPVSWVDPFGLAKESIVCPSCGSLGIDVNNDGIIDEKDSGVLTIHSNGNGILDGHSWIEYTDENGKKSTFGTWGNNPEGKGNGLHSNLELGQTSEASRTLKLNEQGKENFLNTVNKYKESGTNGWKLEAPCSSFAQECWKASTGEVLNAQLGPISNPTTLKKSIIKANSRSNSNIINSAIGSSGRASGTSSIKPLGSILK